MNRSFQLYLHDMRENMELALQFLGTREFNELSSDRQVAYAVIRCLEIIGEAARNIPDDVREQLPEIPWRDIIGMRNKIAYGYFDINLKTVWGVLKEDIPVLLPMVIEATERIQK